MPLLGQASSASGLPPVGIAGDEGAGYKVQGAAGWLALQGDDVIVLGEEP